jgi:hypothetical protein
MQGEPLRRLATVHGFASERGLAELAPPFNCRPLLVPRLPLLLTHLQGRGCGVGRGLGSTLGVAVAVAVAVGVAVGVPPGSLGVGVGLGGGVVVAVAVAVGVGEGVGPPPTAARISTRPQP